MTNLADATWIAPLVAAALAVALAGWILSRWWAERFHRVLAVVLFLTAAVELADSLLLFFSSDALVLRRVGLAAEFLRTAALFALLSVLIGRTSEDADPAAVFRARIAAVVAALGSLGTWWGGFAITDAAPDGESLVLTLGPLGRLLHVVLLVGLALALAQLESIFRASREPFRFRIKYVLLGLAALASFELYVCSQTLLLGAWRFRHAAVGGFVALVSVGLIAFGLGRLRLARTLDRVAVTPQMVYGSFTLLAVGLYLLGIGLLGEVFRLFGRRLNVGTSEVVIFALTTMLVIGLMSRAARARFQAFVARNFLRSRYDYRTKWLEVTDAFSLAESVDEILDRLLGLMARTFGTGRLSIWLRFDADDRFHQVRSVNVEAAPPPLARDHAVVAALAAGDGPMDLETPAPEPFFEATHAVLGVPLQGAGELLGFVALGPGPGGGYDLDDRDLLRAIAHHVGVLLAQAQLAEDRQASAELDALNRFAAFYLHDFKNLTARLSLVAQNAARHGDDPEFRAQAMATVGRTAEQLSELIGQLSRRSPAHGRVAAVDVRALVEGTLASLGPDFGARLEPAGSRVGEVLAVPEQLQQVVLNLVLNAKQASERGGQAGDGPAAVVRLEGGGGRVRLEVADRGPGIPPERLRNLFQPFQSTAPGGFGIGLYESRRIVESYRGSLRVESAPGVGARVVVDLPTVAVAAAVGQTSPTGKESER
jgi:putative PEP-CTERM system histidine kinase